MEIALFIQNLQEERAEVAMFIFTKQTDASQSELRINKRSDLYIEKDNVLYWYSVWQFKKDSPEQIEPWKKE